MGRVREHLAESLVAFRDVFSNPSLRRLQLAYTGSEVGYWASGIALAVLAFESGGAAAIGLLLVIRFLPSALAAPFLSILGDRHDRARVMLSADLVRAVAMALAAVAAFADAPLGVIYALAGVVAVTSTAFRPAQAAILPSLASTPAELTAANVASSTIESVTSFVGPALGGVLLAATDAGVVFAITAGTFLWSALLISRLQTGETARPEERPEESILRTASAGFRAIALDGRVRLLVGLFAAQTFVAGALNVLVVVTALEVLDTGETGVGALNSALGVGGLIGAVGAVALVGRKRLAAAFGAGTLLWGAPIALMAVWTDQAGALVLLGVVGLANTVVDVAGFTLLQRAVADEVLARVFGVLESVLLGTVALGGIVTSLLVEGIGIRAALVAAGVCLPVLVVLTWRWVVQIDAEAPVPERELGLLRGIPFFAALPGATLEQLASSLAPVHVTAGRNVFRQGDHADRFYVIAEGEAGVTVDGQPAQSLAPGGFFGEIALLRDVPRTATVTARTDLELFALERDEFIAAVTGHARSVEVAGAVVASRLGVARPGLGPV